MGPVINHWSFNVVLFSMQKAFVHLTNEFQSEDRRPVRFWTSLCFNRGRFQWLADNSRKQRFFKNCNDVGPIVYLFFFLNRRRARFSFHWSAANWPFTNWRRCGRYLLLLFRPRVGTPAVKTGTRRAIATDVVHFEPGFNGPVSWIHSYVQDLWFSPMIFFICCCFVSVSPANGRILSATVINESPNRQLLQLKCQVEMTDPDSILSYQWSRNGGYMGVNTQVLFYFLFIYFFWWTRIKKVLNDRSGCL